MSKLSNTNFLSKWNTNFADNTTGDISEEDMRDFRQDISDSFVNLTDHIGTGSGFPESLTSSSSISWNLNNKLNGYARLLTGESAIALTLSNFALGSKRTLLIQKTIAGDCVITPSYGAFTFYSNDSTTSSTSTITLRGKENSMFWVDFINYGNSANPLGIRIDVRKEDKDSVFKNIKKTSHGYSVGDIITTASTAYVKLSALTQVPLGIIDLVQGVNGFRVVNSGLVEGLSGLTADTMYYVQSSGVLGTTVTNLPFLWAISTTSGYIVRQDPIEYNTDLKYFDQDDFIGPATFGSGNFTKMGWAASVSGTASAASSNYGVDNTEHALGVVQCSTGTATNDYSSIVLDIYTTLGTGFTSIFKARVAHSALSDGTDTYDSYIGLFDYLANDFTDSVYFKYTHGTNSGNWQCITTSGGTATTNNTAVAGGNTTYSIFEIRINSDATEVLFYIDGVLVATHTTNIPTTAFLGHTIRITKSAGTTARLIYTDWVSLLLTRSTPR